jgi:hypothetical protein
MLYPGECIMENEAKSTPADLHAIGVKAMAELLKRMGHAILTVNQQSNSDPQIVARMERTLAFIIVRTAAYPRKGRLYSDAIIRRLVAHAGAHKAYCYFAGLGITALDDELSNKPGQPESFPDGMAIQVDGTEFFISFSGLELLTSPGERFWQN